MDLNKLAFLLGALLCTGKMWQHLWWYLWIRLCNTRTFLSEQMLHSWLLLGHCMTFDSLNISAVFSSCLSLSQQLPLTSWNLPLILKYHLCCTSGFSLRSFSFFACAFMWLYNKGDVSVIVTQMVRTLMYPLTSIPDGKSFMTASSDSCSVDPAEPCLGQDIKSWANS